MIVVAKLLLSFATLALALGYAARHRANFLHRRLMAAGLALGWLAALLVAGATLAGPAVGLQEALRPAYWLVEALGSQRGAGAAAAAQQVLVLAALAALSGQALLGALRHRWHAAGAWFAIPLWLAAWVSAMFCYY